MARHIFQACPLWVYTQRGYTSQTLNFFLFEPKFVFVLRLKKAVKLATIGFTSGMTADLACQMSSCLCQDYNIVLLFKRDILYTGNVDFTFSLFDGQGLF
jgi:hypothetical protein